MAYNLHVSYHIENLLEFYTYMATYFLTRSSTLILSSYRLSPFSINFHSRTSVCTTKN